MRPVFWLAVLLLWPFCREAAAAPGPAYPPPLEGALRKIPLGLPSGRIIMVEVADTPEGRERGLMHRRKLAKDYGMLFVFPRPASLGFWMKNTFVSLDIVYLDSSKTVTRVHARVRPSTPRTPDEEIARVSGYGQYILELPAGAAARAGIKEGRALKFEVAIPKG